MRGYIAEANYLNRKTAFYLETNLTDNNSCLLVRIICFEIALRYTILISCGVFLFSQTSKRQMQLQPITHCFWAFIQCFMNSERLLTKMQKRQSAEKQHETIMLTLMHMMKHMTLHFRHHHIKVTERWCSCYWITMLMWMYKVYCSAMHFKQHHIEVIRKWCSCY